MHLRKTLINVYAQYWKDVLKFILIGVILSFLELLGISIVLPILDGTSSSTTKIPYPLSMVSAIFIDMEFNTKLKYIAVILVIIFFVKGIFAYINGILGAKLERKVSKNYVLKCYKGISKVNAGYLDSVKETDLFTKSVAFAGSYGNIIRLIANMVPMLMTLVILMVALLMIYPIMLILSLSVAVLSTLLIRNIHKKSELAGKKITQANKKLNFKFIEEISGLKTRRLSNSINHSINFIKQRLDEWSGSFLGLEKLIVSIRPVIELIGIVSLAIILLGFSYFLVDSNMFVDNSTALLTFMVVFSRILSPVSSINQSISGIKSNLPYVKITEEFLSELEVDKVVDGRIEKTKLEKSIEFKNVFFRYNKSTNDALTDVSFLIPLGSKVGIVGLSGSGKSSLVDLLLRHYDPYSGNILIDGIDLKDIALVSWYEILGVVNQDPFLFDSSISYNISFGQDSGNLQKTIKAAKKAHIHDFIQSLPDGYDSIVGGRGDLLSGGQRQRISIARALFHNPDVLIFDEATSALDSETELDIRLAIEELSTSKTIIMVAHRMSTILDSDIIIVMDKGKIIQYGNPDELIKQKDKKFYQLLKGQSNG